MDQAANAASVTDFAATSLAAASAPAADLPRSSLFGRPAILLSAETGTRRSRQAHRLAGTTQVAAFQTRP